MGRIKEDGLNQSDIDIINKKRLVFIVDECHRSTFGDMLLVIKNTFPRAVFFGFTGTPILDENNKKDNTTATVFGNELHRYSIADGINDGNVLGFDKYKVLTFKDIDIRRAVALNQSKSATEEEAINDNTKKEKYLEYINNKKMFGVYDEVGNYEKGIEDYIPSSQYRTYEHQNKVVEDILENWSTLSLGNKFSAIFATSSIPEAIEYYKLFKTKNASLKITALFDPNIDNTDGFIIKEEGLVEIIEDYNRNYDQQFTIPKYGKMKKDISLRLAHKKPYNKINSNEQIDLLIVVDQMLTGFDSKWLNALYLDKLLKYENVIQAFSRTNRLFGNEKPFGIIKYYRKPHTMEQNINRAIKLYSGDEPEGLFVQKLDKNLKKLNYIYNEIYEIFQENSINNFETLPESLAAKNKFAVLFRDFNNTLESSKIQGFIWNKDNYKFDNEAIEVIFNEISYTALLMRYKELFDSVDRTSEKGNSVPFDLDGYVTTIDTGKINSEYMNEKFEKYLRVLDMGDIDPIELDKTLNELHKSFASLTQIEQKYANIFLRDVERGQVKIDSDKKIRDYITEYQLNAENDQIHKISTKLGIDEYKLRKIMSLKITDSNINEFGRFDELINSCDKKLAKNFFEAKMGKELSNFEITLEIRDLLREYILLGGFDIDNYSSNIL